MSRSYVFTIASTDPRAGTHTHTDRHTRTPSYSQNMQNAAVDFDQRSGSFKGVPLKGSIKGYYKGTIM